MRDYRLWGLAETPAPSAGTLVARADAVWLWPGVPLTIEQDGVIEPIAGPWVRSWVNRLHGFEAQHAPLEEALNRAAGWLNAGDPPAAQSALDAAGLNQVSPEGAVLMRVVAARLGVRSPDLPVGVRSLPWGAANVAAAARLFDLFAGAAIELEKIYNPGQPRWPAGAPASQGGRFAPAGPASGAPPNSAPSSAPPSSSSGSEATPGVGHNEGPPLDELPDIPVEDPGVEKLRNIVARAVALWLLKRGVAMLVPGVGEAIAIIGTAVWLYQKLPYINAFLEKPQTLEELQTRANDPKEGYQIHHIVEQTPTGKEGFPKEKIESPENKVRISTIRHWEISSWYSTPNGEYKGMSPREYLRGKNWEERRNFGIKALKDFGVLK